MNPIDIRPGQSVADRTLIQLLGSGGEGQVWKASRPDGTYCALKIILPEVLPTPEEVRDRGRWLVRIDHPSMVTVTRGGRFTGGDLAGWGFVEMELVEGQSMQNAPANPNALQAMAGIAEALDLLHHGVWSDGVSLIHRDVKPGNLIWTNQGLVLVDPSTMRRLDSQEITRVGTPAYVAPEVSSGFFDEAADIFSFAATVTALTTGLRGQPLRTLIDSPNESDLPKAVIAGLSLNPSNRPRTCTEIVTGRFRPRSTLIAQPKTLKEPQYQQYTQPQPAQTLMQPGFLVQHQRPQAKHHEGADWEGAARVESRRGRASRLSPWAVLSLMVVLGMIFGGYFAIKQPSIDLQQDVYMMLLGAGVLIHLVIHFLNGRPLLSLLLPTYAWGAAMGDTAGSRRDNWVRDVSSGWFTVWAVTIGEYLLNPDSIVKDLLSGQGFYDLPEYSYIFIGLMIWFGAMLIRWFGRRGFLIYILGAIINFPFQLLGGIPRWVLRW